VLVKAAPIKQRKKIEVQKIAVKLLKINFTSPHAPQSSSIPMIKVMSDDIVSSVVCCTVV